jgi:protein gp37
MGSGAFRSIKGKRIGGEVIRRAMHRLWLGVSAEDQLTADTRILPLLTLPVTVRFLSYEPALGPVNICRFLDATENSRRIDWVIAGGESGPFARPAHPDWFRSMRDQCVDAGIPFFFKQHGAWLATELDGGHARFVNSAGEFVPANDKGVVRVTRVGKAAVGAMLDGKEHRDRP